MQFVFSDSARLLWLIAGCGLLWSLESVVPLYRSQSGRSRHLVPNLALTILLIVTNLAIAFGMAYVVELVARREIGLSPWLGLSAPSALVLGIAGMDFFAYVAHVLLHKTRIGWRLHRVHHSDNAVDVTTAFRQHPGETVWRIFWQVAAIVVFGVPVWVAAVYLTMSTANAQLEHANIKVPVQLDRILRLGFVTPNMHKTHHSRLQRETDSNYSNIFSVWDRIFGTYTAVVDFETLSYGLDGFDSDERQSLAGLLRLPFLKTA